MKLAELLRTAQSNDFNNKKTFKRIDQSDLSHDIQKNALRNSKSQPAFVAREVDNKDLFDQKKEKSKTKHNFAEISEEPHEMISRNVEIDNELQQRNRLSDVNKKNIFEAEMIESSRYSNRAKGPIYVDGKLVRHSVVGTAELFEKHQLKIQKRITNKIHNTASNSSFMSWVESIHGGISKNRSMSTGIIAVDSIPTVNRTTSSQGRRISIGGRQKEMMNIPKVSKQELMHEIEDIKARQDKFYSDMQNSITKMSKTAQLNLTKDERCLKKFEKIQNQWTNVLDKANNRLGRSASQSIVARGEEQRVKKEQQDTLEIIKSDWERYGENVWRMTLRKAADSNDQISLQSKSRPSLGVQERPSSSVEVIRHPKLTPTSSNTWRASFFRTGLNPSTERSMKEYIREKVERNHKKLNGLKATGDGIDTLMLHGENVLNLEIESVFKNTYRDDNFPVILDRSKKEHEEQIIKENYDKKYLYANGFTNKTKLKKP